MRGCVSLNNIVNVRSRQTRFSGLRRVLPDCTGEPMANGSNLQNDAPKLLRPHVIIAIN
jgi:hypothetical protein